MLQFKGQSVWFHSINSVQDVAAIYGYVENMLMEQSYLDPPATLAGRHFQRYLVDTAEPCEQSC
jgi:cobaltochelatase CobN